MVKGDPTPEELAALIAVIGTRAAAAADGEPAPRSLWAAPVLRAPLLPGPGGWRASGLPR